MLRDENFISYKQVNALHTPGRPRLSVQDILRHAGLDPRRYWLVGAVHRHGWYIVKRTDLGEGLEPEVTLSAVYGP